MPTYVHSTELIKEIRGTDVKVIDGDTIILNGKRIRLEGIDAPEIGQTCGMTYGKWECGKHAKAMLINIISNQEIICQNHGLGKYKRILGTCYLADDIVDINKLMVRNGMAFAYIKYSNRYLYDEHQAVIDSVGMWNSYFKFPWDYRKSKRKHAKNEKETL